MREICMPGGFVALVDDEDYEWLIRDYAWHKIKGESTFYAHAWLRGSKPKRKVYMHRIILGVPKGIEVDHIDGNGLNNRRNNLRSCTSSENHFNSRKRRLYGGIPTTSLYKGVTQNKKSGNWITRIYIRGKQTHVGAFPTELEAAAAYDMAAIREYGRFAKVNNTLGEAS
jgi:hypothetical protein